MKKTRIFAVLLVVALMLAGCSNRDKQNSSSSVIPPVSSTPSSPSSTVSSAISKAESKVESEESKIGDDVSDALSGSDSISEPIPSSSLPGSSSVSSSASSNSSSLSSSEVSDKDVVSTMSTDFSEIGALDAKKEGWGPGGPTDNLKRPDGATVYQDRYGKYDAYFIGRNAKKVYLTFDEGYENSYTASILDTLKEKNAKAVFFVTLSYVKSEPALVKRMIEEGHTLGNHSSKHLSFPDMPLMEAAKDVMQLHEYMLANYGYKLSLFRPPMGEFSEQTLALLQSIGYKSVFWSFAYRDWLVDDQPLTIEALASITEKCHPGAIYLLHAVSQTNAEILGDAIDNIRGQGYEVASWDIY